MRSRLHVGSPAYFCYLIILLKFIRWAYTYRENWNTLLSRISLCKPKFSVLQILHTTYPLFISSLQENLKCRIYFHRKIQLVLSHDLSTAAKISCLYSTSKSVGEAADRSCHYDLMHPLAIPLVLWLRSPFVFCFCFSWTGRQMKI